MGFEFLDISGDAGVKAYGGSLAEAFESAALGMYSLITDLEGIKEEKTVRIEKESRSIEGLLVAWLNELIFLFDAYGFIGKKITIDRLENNAVVSSVTGEDFDAERHEQRLLIKAATYHDIKVENKGGRWELSVIFDI